MATLRRAHSRSKSGGPGNRGLVADQLAPVVREVDEWKLSECTRDKTLHTEHRRNDAQPEQHCIEQNLFLFGIYRQ